MSLHSAMQACSRTSAESLTKPIGMIGCSAHWQVHGAGRHLSAGGQGSRDSLGQPGSKVGMQQLGRVDQQPMRVLPQLAVVQHQTLYHSTSCRQLVHLTVHDATESTWPASICIRGSFISQDMANIKVPAQTTGCEDADTMVTGVAGVSMRLRGATRGGKLHLNSCDQAALQVA